MTDPDPEERAFDLLQWNPYSLPTEYDDDLALIGYYSKTQAERSNRALDAWEKEHPFKSSDELTAFRELERLGVYTNADFFSPSTRPRMVTTPNESNSSGTNPESLRDHQELLNRLDQYAGTVLSNEEDPLRRCQLLRLYADEVGFPLTEKTASVFWLTKAQGAVSGVCAPRMRGEKMDTTPTPWAGR